MIRRIEESLTEEGKSVEFSEDFSVYSADGEFSQSAGHSNDSSSGARSSLRSGSLRSGSYTQSTGSSGRRRARNAPLQARTSNPKSKSAASIVRELNELKFSSLDLYGRDEELEILHAAYRRLGKDTKSDNNKRKKPYASQKRHSSDTCHSLKKDPMNMVILEGLSGTGKSSLVKEFRRQLAKTSATTSAIFASGKFDQLHQQRAAKPYSAFTVAFEQLCGQYSARYASPEDNPLRDAMKRDYKILIDLIPNLVTELNLDENDNKMSDTVSKDSSMLYDSKEFDIVKSQRRFQYAVRTFLRTTCKPEHPTILFLDDMQWSDQPSLDLLEYILSEPVLQETILVIGSYRSNEVDQNHPLSRMIKTLEKARERSVERIRLSNLSLKDVNQFIADLFNSSLEETRPLAEIAQKKVQGNAFFLIQFLTALRDGGYLEYNIGTMKWTWELNSIRKSIVVASNVLTYLMQRMKYLPDTLRRILLIVSCLGSSFDEQVVNVLANGLAGSEILPLASDEAAQDLLRQLQIEGLLESFQAQDGRSSYCFAHDQIELAAQSLQDDDTIHVLKLQMARILYDSRDQLDFSGNLFLIVDLWNESREEVIEPGDEGKLIDLNQLAGSKALDLSAFDAAIHYFRSAIALIPMDCQWKDENYSRTLELYNSLIKAEFSAGSWEHLSNDINTILKQSERPILDKIVAYTVRITVLSSHENKHEEAIALAVEVLEKLGIKFRPGLGKLAIIGGLIKTKQLLKKIPLDSLLSQSPMDNKNKEVGMDILTSVTSSLYAANPDLYMTGILKILRWSLKYGTTKHTSRCIGLYGLVEMALGNLEGATSACKLAGQLAEEQDLMKSEYAPITSVYGFVFPWTHPLQNCQKKIYDGYNVGLQTGDMEYAMMNIALFGFFCYSNGKPLSDLEADMRDYAEQMEECNMMLQLKFLSLTWQTMLNLLGRSDDPLTLTGEAMNQEEMLEDAERENNPPLKAQLYCHQLQLAVYFGDFDLASSLIRHTSCISAVNPANPIIWRTALFEGVTAFEMVRRGHCKKYRSVAAKSLKRMKGWVDQGNPNCVHILYLLQAEKASCNGAFDEARMLYDKSIATAGRNGFRSDRALANERCASMFQQCHDDFWSTEYFHKAYDLYVEFEAHAKVEQMQKDYSFLRPSMDLSNMENDEQPSATPSKPEEHTSDTDDLPSTDDLPDTVTFHPDPSEVNCGSSHASEAIGADNHHGQHRRSSFLRQHHHGHHAQNSRKSLAWSPGEKSSLELSQVDDADAGVVDAAHPPSGVVA